MSVTVNMSFEQYYHVFCKQVKLIYNASRSSPGEGSEIFPVNILLKPFAMLMRNSSEIFLGLKCTFRHLVAIVIPFVWKIHCCWWRTMICEGTQGAGSDTAWTTVNMIVRNYGIHTFQFKLFLTIIHFPYGNILKWISVFKIKLKNNHNIQRSVCEAEQWLEKNN